MTTQSARSRAHSHNLPETSVPSSPPKQWSANTVIACMTMPPSPFPYIISGTVKLKVSILHRFQLRLCVAAASRFAAALMLCAASAQTSCAAAFKLCAAAFKLCAATFKLFAAVVKLCAAAFKLCAVAFKICAATFKLCAAVVKLCAAAALVQMAQQSATDHRLRTSKTWRG